MFSGVSCLAAYILVTGFYRKHKNRLSHPVVITNIHAFYTLNKVYEAKPIHLELDDRPLTNHYFNVNEYSMCRKCCALSQTINSTLIFFTGAVFIASGLLHFLSVQQGIRHREILGWIVLREIALPLEAIVVFTAESEV